MYRSFLSWCFIAILASSCGERGPVLEAQQYRLLVRGESAWVFGGQFLEFQLMHDAVVSGWGSAEDGSSLAPRSENVCPSTLMSPVEHQRLTDLLNTARATERESDISGCIDADEVTFTVEMNHAGGLGNDFLCMSCERHVEALDAVLVLAVDVLERCDVPAR